MTISMRDLFSRRGIDNEAIGLRNSFAIAKKSFYFALLNRESKEGM